MVSKRHPQPKRLKDGKIVQVPLAQIMQQPAAQLPDLPVRLEKTIRKDLKGIGYGG